MHLKTRGRGRRGSRLAHEVHVEIPGRHPVLEHAAKTEPNARVFRASDGCAYAAQRLPEEAGSVHGEEDIAR